MVPAEKRLRYDHPLVGRYATKEMSAIWSPQNKIATWRRLWVALAEAQAELGLPISEEQLEELRANVANIDFELAARKERELRHDVMAHIHAYGAVCPRARGVIHLGATSCFVQDNADLLSMRAALRVLRRKTARVLSLLASKARMWRDVACLSFTHYQAAQLTTMGKRCCLWAQDLWLDLQQIETLLNSRLPLRGVKGTTGTEASFLELFDGDHAKCRRLNELVCAKMEPGVRAIPVSGQTYTRKIDFEVLSAISGVGQSVYKMCADIRLLSHDKELDEPFESEQVGSSAMPYKRNPMRCERACSLSRYIMTLPAAAAETAAQQWLERTLDDSAIRRITLPEAFLACDVVLGLASNIIGGLVLSPRVVASRVAAELPFMASEAILMAAVRAGGDRQDLHEALRVHSQAAGRRVREEGLTNDLLDRIRTDPLFACVHDQLDTLMHPARFVGRAPQQVEEFLAEHLEPTLEPFAEELARPDIDTVTI